MRFRTPSKLASDKNDLLMQLHTNQRRRKSSVALPGKSLFEKEDVESNCSFRTEAREALTYEVP
jgi:hypothetical protein